MASRARSLGPAPISDVLRGARGLPKSTSVEGGPVPPRVWELAVGTRIAARARPYRLDHGVLHVLVSSATWSQELSLLSTDILAQLKTHGISADSLRFRVGTVAPPERPPTRDEPRRAPPLAPLPGSLKNELQHIEDAELRAAIERAAARSLGWDLLQKPSKTRPKRPSRPSPEASVSETTPVVTSTRRGARAPQSAASESAPPAQRSTPSRGAKRGKPGA